MLNFKIHIVIEHHLKLFVVVLCLEKYFSFKSHHFYLFLIQWLFRRLLKNVLIEGQWVFGGEYFTTRRNFEGLLGGQTSEFSTRIQRWNDLFKHISFSLRVKLAKSQGFCKQEDNPFLPFYVPFSDPAQHSLSIFLRYQLVCILLYERQNENVCIWSLEKRVLRT